MSDKAFQADFCAGWANCLLEGLAELPENQREKLLSHCAGFHWRENRMDRVTQQFQGDLEGFLSFLTESWGWKITRLEGENRLLADENKKACVCPLAVQLGETVSPLLCGCSEKFAGAMFSAVLEREAHARVRRSVLRGGESCVYEICW